jgi:hypothetical protein
LTFLSFFFKYLLNITHQTTGPNNEKLIPYHKAVKKATNSTDVTIEEQKNSNRLVKILKLKPIILKDKSGDEYALLGNEDVAKDMRQKRRLKVSILIVEAKKKKKKL